MNQSYSKLKIERLNKEAQKYRKGYTGIPSWLIGTIASIIIGAWIYMCIKL